MVTDCLWWSDAVKKQTKWIFGRFSAQMHPLHGLKDHECGKN